MPDDEDIIFTPLPSPIVPQKKRTIMCRKKGQKQVTKLYIYKTCKFPERTNYSEFRISHRSVRASQPIVITKHYTTRNTT